MQNIDITIIHACQQGDRDAFQRIYEVYSQRVYSLVYRYTHDAEETLDLTQEIFLRIYTRIADFRGECSLETWIYRIAANTAISSIRKSKPNELLSEEISGPQSKLPNNQIEFQELECNLENAIALLPETVRMAFVLVAVEHRSYAETAEILDLRVEAVRMRVSRARKILRTTLQPYLDEGKLS